MIRRPPKSTPLYSSAASDVYKRQPHRRGDRLPLPDGHRPGRDLSLIHISEPTRQAENSYAVFCLKKKKKKTPHHIFFSNDTATTEIYTSLFVGSVRCV